MNAVEGLGKEDSTEQAHGVMGSLRHYFRKEVEMESLTGQLEGRSRVPEVKEVVMVSLYNSSEVSLLKGRMEVVGAGGGGGIRETGVMAGGVCLEMEVEDE